MPDICTADPAETVRHDQVTRFLAAHAVSPTILEQYHGRMRVISDILPDEADTRFFFLKIHKTTYTFGSGVEARSSLVYL